MGILTSIITRIGIPLALAVGAGLIIARFKDQIVGGISAGASTVGTAITTPFGSFLQGINEGLSNIPKTIDFTFPSFNFGFAQGADPAGDKPNEVATDIDQALINLCRNSGGLLCFGDSGMTGAGGGNDNNQSQQQTLTPFRDTFITTQSSGVDVKFKTETIEQILARNKGAVGLFDFLGTTGVTEFFALTPAEIKFFGAENLKFSGQLFKEIGSTEEALAFA